jgi:hypothetical protein
MCGLAVTLSRVETLSEWEVPSPRHGPSFCMFNCVEPFYPTIR